MNDHDPARELLSRFREGPVPVESAPEQAIRTLQEAGVEFTRTNGKVHLEVLPNYAWPRIEYGLQAPCTVSVHQTLESTNDQARNAAKAGQRDHAIFAVEQTAGRGRRDRTWDSPPGGVWGSLVLTPQLPPHKSGLATFAAAVAVVDMARESGVSAEIKWPNDVQIANNGKVNKLAGVLTERGGGQESWLIIGFGINADIPAATLPTGATSLRVETGDAVDRAAVARSVLERVYDLVDDPSRTLSAWRDRTATLGQRVSVQTESESIVGEATDVTETGALIIDTGSRNRTVTTGDCRHLRSA